MKILITGATGFIGSHIAKTLLELKHEVYATQRTTSSFEKCHAFKDRINWINTDNSDWKEQINNIRFDQVIHAAWGGIESGDRNNWELQIKNFWFSKELFDWAKNCKVKKVIALGSQAEYGNYGFPVSEETAPMPNDAYGAIKTLTANYLRNIFDNSDTHWYWVRIFSVFGENENPGWLMPTVIAKLLNNESVALTPCEQQYNYLFIDDFISQFIPVIRSTTNKSGIYNICNSESTKLKDLLIQLALLMDISPKLLQFGAIPYRHGQNMYIAGDDSKYKSCFSVDGEKLIGLTNGLLKTINYHKKSK